MPQGTTKSGGGALGGMKGTKARNGSFSGSATRTKTVSDCASGRRREGVLGLRPKKQLPPPCAQSWSRAIV